MSRSGDNPRVIEDDDEVKGRCFALVASRFNESIVQKLIEGATGELVRRGVAARDITVVWCPGAFEIPAVTARLVESGRFDSVITLGCVIRGATDHYQYVAGEAARGVADVALTSPVPVLFGVLTTDTIEQAIERSGPNESNKGTESAAAAIRMVNLYAALEKELGKA